MRRTTVATIGAIAAVGAFGVGAGTASAAPAERPLSVEQVPNAGVTVGANGITGGFVAGILASATAMDKAATKVALRAAGVPKLQLLVRRENAKAGAFYQSLGYEESTSVMPAKWLDGREATP